VAADGATPSPQIRQLRALLHAREDMVEITTKWKNIGHGALTRTGLTVAGSAFASARGRQRRAETEGLPDGDRHILRVALQQIEAVEQAGDTLEQELVRQGKALPGLRRLLRMTEGSLFPRFRIITDHSSCDPRRSSYGDPRLSDPARTFP
jgi:hypothetical protein